MKKIIFSMGLVCLGILSFAQIPLKKGETAPDFVYSDINGISHQLYNYTDSGYTVILNIFSTMSTPSWNAHSSQVMNLLTQNYGPTGVINPMKIKVLSFEADNTTTLADLNGSGPNTLGNWLLNANHPIFNNDSIKMKYPINGYSHFYVVCPNRVITYSHTGYNGTMGVESFWLPFMQNCTVKSTQLYAATVITSETPTSLCPNSTIPSVLKIQNLGTDSLMKALIESQVVGSSVIDSFIWYGNLKTYEFDTVTLNPTTFSAGTTYTIHKINPINIAIFPELLHVATDSLIASSTALSSNYKTWTLAVRTDLYPKELTWKVVRESNGAIVQQKSYDSIADVKKLYYYPLTLLANECYRIEVADSYGDGLMGSISSIDTGFVKLYEDTTLAPLINFGANFERGVKVNVKTGAQSVKVNDIETSTLEVYPNPASTSVFVRGIEGNAKFIFTDILGRTMKVVDMPNISNIATLDVSDFSSGAYFLQINYKNTIVTKKLIISK